MPTSLLSSKSSNGAGTASESGNHTPEEELGSDNDDYIVINYMDDLNNYTAIVGIEMSDERKAGKEPVRRKLRGSGSTSSARQRRLKMGSHIARVRTALSFSSLLYLITSVVYVHPGCVVSLDRF